MSLLETIWTRDYFLLFIYLLLLLFFLLLSLSLLFLWILLKLSVRLLYHQVQQPVFPSRQQQAVTKVSQSFFFARYKTYVTSWFFTLFALINCRLPSEFHVDGRRVWLGPWEHRFLWVQAAGLQSPQCGMWTLNEDYELYTYYSVRYVSFKQILWTAHSVRHV